MKVANTHSCRHTCYKYRKNKVCRFGYPREIVEESTVTDENIILLKRLSEMVNNYNPYLMTCLRSNHDINFVPSGKDGYNIAFYFSEYAIKSQMSTQQIVPLICVSKKQVNVSYASSSCSERTRMLVNKCLNRILTETEISAAHVSHFLLGYEDKKTSDKFTRLNLHNVIGWLETEIKKYNHNSDLAIPFTGPNLPDEALDNADDNDDRTDHDDVNATRDMYSIRTGNTGFVLVNNMTDYLNRGSELEYMCIYEYCSEIEKKKFSDKEKENI